MHEQQIPPCELFTESDIAECLHGNSSVKRLFELLSVRLQSDTRRKTADVLYENQEITTELSDSERDAGALLLSEHKRKKFLGHVFFNTSQKNAIRELKAGRSLHYEPSGICTGEIAFSLHVPNGAMIGKHRFGFPRKNSIGAAVFHDSFYDKICSSEISDDLWKPTQEWLIKENCMDMMRPRSFDGKMKKKSCIETISDHVHMINGKPMDDQFIDDESEENSDRLWGIIKCLISINALRTSMQIPNYASDIGVRAAQLDVDRNLRSLPIQPEDIKFLIARHNHKLCTLYTNN